MTELPTSFWGGWITVLTLGSLAGLAWFVISVYFGRDDSHAPGEGPRWDVNLREGSNPAPMWWFWLLFGTMILSVIYLMLYPGLGTFKGALQWSQGGRLAQSSEAYERQFGGRRRLIAEGQLSTLHQDPDVMRSARRVYDRNCAVCHGYEAQGQAQMFPDLRDADWQWGGSPEQIEVSIRNGRNAVMVGWEQVLGDDGINNVIDYVRALKSGSTSSHPGQTQYNQLCLACHGADGSGNVALGAPNLIDDYWLYGDSDEVLYETLAKGRAGVMPAFGSRLDEAQIRMLVALLTSDEFQRQ